MALSIRIIPCLDVTDGRVVKGVNFTDLVDAGIKSRSDFKRSAISVGRSIGSCASIVLFCLRRCGCCEWNNPERLNTS